MNENQFEFCECANCVFPRWYHKYLANSYCIDFKFKSNLDYLAYLYERRTK
jgi:hypothetical protein